MGLKAFSHTNIRKVDLKDGRLLVVDIVTNKYCVTCKTSIVPSDSHCIGDMLYVPIQINASSIMVCIFSLTSDFYSYIYISYTSILCIKTNKLV